MIGNAKAIPKRYMTLLLLYLKIPAESIGFFVSSLNIIEISYIPLHFIPSCSQLLQQFRKDKTFSHVLSFLPQY